MSPVDGNLWAKLQLYSKRQKWGGKKRKSNLHAQTDIPLPQSNT